MPHLPYILAHFIGDFLLQNDWLAVNKKRSNVACTVHVLLYMVPFVFVEATPLQYVLIATQHWAQDRSAFVAWYCRFTRSFQDELKQSGIPWGHVMVDQVFHILWMWGVMNLI